MMREISRLCQGSDQGITLATSYPPEERAEVVTPILTWDDLVIVQEIVRALCRAGCEVNGEAGLHVHVGAEHLTGKMPAILAKLVDLAKAFNLPVIIHNRGSSGRA